MGSIVNAMRWIVLFAWYLLASRTVQPAN